MLKKRSKINYYIHKYFFIPLKIFRKSLIDTIRHDGIEHAGYLAFLSILSFFPSLIFLIAVIGFFGESKIGTDFLYKIISELPNEMSRGLTPRIKEIISGPSDGYLTIAIIGVIWTASSSVEGCRTILNRAYRVAFPPPYILRRLVSIFEFFIIIFVIISGILIFVIVPVILKYFEKQFSIKLAID
jgi:membrane protein